MNTDCVASSIATYDIIPAFPSGHVSIPTFAGNIELSSVPPRIITTSRPEAEDFIENVNRADDVDGRTSTT